MNKQLLLIVGSVLLQAPLAATTLRFYNNSDQIVGVRVIWTGACKNEATQWINPGQEGRSQRDWCSISSVTFLIPDKANPKITDYHDSDTYKNVKNKDFELYTDNGIVKIQEGSVTHARAAVPAARPVAPAPSVSAAPAPVPPAAPALPGTPAPANPARERSISEPTLATANQKTAGLFQQALTRINEKMRAVFI